jgi:hypothetical protein
MKSNLRMLGLALCILPACLRASIAQDQKPSYQREQSERPAELIPTGTTVPWSGVGGEPHGLDGMIFYFVPLLLTVACASLTPALGPLLSRG